MKTWCWKAQALDPCNHKKYCHVIFLLSWLCSRLKLHLTEPKEELVVVVFGLLFISSYPGIPHLWLDWTDFWARSHQGFVWNKLLLLCLSLGNIYTHCFILGYPSFLRLIAYVFIWSASIPMCTSIIYSNSSAEILATRPWVQPQRPAGSFLFHFRSWEGWYFALLRDASHNLQLQEKVDKMPLSHCIFSSWAAPREESVVSVVAHHKKA